jgi:iron complex transport system ATP-binding protein
MKLEVKGLSFSFGEKRVLRDVTLEVGHGELLGLMGPNGSGKTTLLRCLMNYLPAGGSQILIDERPLTDFSPVELAKTFAVVPQASSTDFVFNAHEIVMMGRTPHIEGRLAGATKADAAIVKEAMKQTNTWQFALRQFSELSGGERQRVIIARAIAQEPRALLLDEPTVYLDINGQIEIMDLIKRLNREKGITTIAVLHDVNLAARYCDRIALLSEGSLEAIGTPKEVLTPENVQSVYDVAVVVRKDPFTGGVYVMPHSSPSSSRRHGTRVHLLCGGGTGGPIMKTLTDRGFSVSAGVLNVLDTDFESAKDLHVATAEEAPFSPVGEESHAKNMELSSESSALVVSPFPVGPGNLKNLEVAVAALKSGKAVFILPPEKGKEIDFVGGKADAIIAELISAGAVRVADVEEVIARLGRGARA